MTIARASITGVVLAGGQGLRMGGVEKGFAMLDGRPLVEWVLERFAPQVGALLVSANRNADRYARFGHPVLPDAHADFAGPLAGVHAALATAATPWLASAPCDSPYLPADLVARLAGAVDATGAALAVARTAERTHPVFALMRTDLHAHLAAYLAAGGRRVERWHASLAVAEVLFDEEAGAFRNLNPLAELAAAQAR